MKLNLFFLSAAAMVSTVSGTCETDISDALGDAGNFVILAKTGISTVPTSAITGDIAISSETITSAAITGFSLIIDDEGKFSTSSQVSGNVLAPDYDLPTPSHVNATVMEMEDAYDEAVGCIATINGEVNLKGGLIGGETLTPGLYTFTEDVSIAAGKNLTFTGGESDIFIIRTTGNVLQAVATSVILAGGAKAKNIFWSVAGRVDVGADAHMEGILLVKTGVTFITGSSLNGRIFSQTAVTLQKATITQPE
jgi:hypothetical protein